MINLRKYLLNTKLMIGFEPILLVLVIMPYFFGGNFVVGISFTLVIVFILSWMILLGITIHFYNKIY